MYKPPGRGQAAPLLWTGFCGTYTFIAYDRKILHIFYAYMLFLPSMPVHSRDAPCVHPGGLHPCFPSTIPVEVNLLDLVGLPAPWWSTPLLLVPRNSSCRPTLSLAGMCWSRCPLAWRLGLNTRSLSSPAGPAKLDEYLSVRLPEGRWVLSLLSHTTM